MQIAVKGWSEFQHYKHRSPPWIRLHRTLLDNYEYQCLPVASRALAPMLWLLASESKDGLIDADLKKLSFRLRTTPKEIDEALKPLIESGFFIVASGVLAECLQDASEIGLQSRDRVETEEVTPISKSKDSKSKPFPKDFSITPELESWASQNGFTRLPERLEHFKGYAIANGKKYADWNQAFQNAVRGDWAKLGHTATVTSLFAGAL